jgi:hypothetical protein
MHRSESGGQGPESVLLPKKRKFLRKFLLVEIDEDVLQDVFQLLRLESVAEEEEEEFEDEDCEEIRKVEEKLLNSFRLTDTQEPKKVVGGQETKRRKF